MRTIIVFTMIMATLSACKSDPTNNSKSSPTQTAETPQEASKQDSATATKVTTKAQSAGAHTLTPGGQRFEPPVKPESLPSGSYYCDMGTVHYARSEEGDNTCPICKMKLTHKP